MLSKENSFISKCSVEDCPAFANKKLQKHWCGNNGFCEKMEICNAYAKDKDLNFKYRDYNSV